MKMIIINNKKNKKILEVILKNLYKGIKLDKSSIIILKYFYINY